MNISWGNKCMISETGTPTEIFYKLARPQWPEPLLQRAIPAVHLPEIATDDIPLRCVRAYLLRLSMPSWSLVTISDPWVREASCPSYCVRTGLLSEP